MIRLRIRILLVGLLAAGCRAGPPRAELPPVPGAAPSDTSCTLAAGPVVARDTVTLAVTDAVDPSHAPLPRNDAERLVFAQLYESLLRLDCQGRALPGLAKSWSQDGDRWTFTLREDARFWDGAPVTALDVVAAWRSRDSSLARAATIADDHTLSVGRRAGGLDLPLQMFADPALSITKPAPGGNWRIGTGRYWMTGAETGAPDVLLARPVGRRGLPVISITLLPPDGARDALDGGADMLVVDDPATVEYAARLRGYTDVPLEWTRTYALLVPPGERAGEGLGDLRLESLREAVHGDARPADASSEGGHPWFADVEHCEIGARHDAVDAAARRRRIVYNQADRSAADLAARLVGLGVLGRGTTAAGLPATSFAPALRAGGDAAYVVELHARVYDACRAAALELPPWSAAGKVVPLLDVRSHVVLRRAPPRLWSEWDGTLRFAPPAALP